MSIILFLVFIFFTQSHQTPMETSRKKLNVQKYEDYTFEGALTRAKDECSYMSLVNDTIVRNRTLQMIKEKISHKKLKEFYEQKEIEKEKAKEFYENIEKQTRRRVLEEEEGRRRFGLSGPFPPGPFPPSPFPSGPIPPLPHPHPQPQPPSPPFRRNLFKRSTELSGRRRKTSSLFSEVSFTDHNNCSSRCLFARMEMVDSDGFPDESLITKLIEDKILNKKLRLIKTRRVNSCFKRMEEVAFDDSCIFSSRLFDCLDLGESSWSGL